jgi:hypothetical protein
MNRRALVAALTITLAASTPAARQMLQPTPLPTVTADNERWYQDGRPVAFAGSLYYPAGAQIFFNPSEMVRSGFFEGVPLYTRTTIEPYSVVYVPLAGGRMQPYERPRTGELTGTAGSTPTLLPTPPSTVPPGGLAPQAAGAPASTTTSIPVQLPRPMVAEPMPQPTMAVEPPSAVGTTGAFPRRPSHVSIGGKPQGANAIFIEFDGRRWYPTGPASAINLSGMVRVGEYYGFEVLTPSAGSQEVYIPSTAGGSAVVRYTISRPKGL